MATVTTTPASGSITAAHTSVLVHVDAATQNDDTAYDAGLYPASPEVRYYLTFEEGGSEYGRSYVFAVDENGDHDFMNYMFPHAGSWTVHLRKVSDDSSVANVATTVA